MATLILVAFITYLYAPYLVFKFFADIGVDLGSKRDTSKVEEFFGAAAPSLLLNGIAYFLMRIFTKMPGVDWLTAASIFEGDKFHTLAVHFSRVPDWEIRYYLALLITSITQGLVYGQVERRLILDPARAGERRGFWWRAAMILRVIWSPFFGDQIIWISTAAMQLAPAFIRTKDGMLFYGRIWTYTKTNSGEIEGCILIDVQRYSREKVADCITKLKNPLRRLHGSLFLKWSEVEDMNFVEPYVIAGLRRTYARQLRQRRRELRSVASDSDWPV